MAIFLFFIILIGSLIHFFYFYISKKNGTLFAWYKQENTTYSPKLAEKDPIKKKYFY